MFNPAISRLTAPPVSVVQDWRASYDGARGQLIDMSQAVPGYAAHPDMTAALESAAANPDSARYGRVEGIWTRFMAPASRPLKSTSRQAATRPLSPRCWQWQAMAMKS